MSSEPLTPEQFNLLTDRGKIGRAYQKLYSKWQTGRIIKRTNQKQIQATTNARRRGADESNAAYRAVASYVIKKFWDLKHSGPSGLRLTKNVLFEDQKNIFSEGALSDGTVGHWYRILRRIWDRQAWFNDITAFQEFKEATQTEYSINRNNRIAQRQQTTRQRQRST